MEISPDHKLLLQQATSVFCDHFNLNQKWLLTGQWSDGLEKLISLLKGEITISSYNFHQLNLPPFTFKYKVSFVSFQQGINDRHATYYQQRFHATEVDRIVTLKKFLFGDHPPIKIVHGNYELLDLFHLKKLLDEEIIKLSNGENRKATILKALLKNPEVLILDNPFAGIDQTTAPELDLVFANLINKGISLIIKSTNPRVPSWVSHVFLADSPENIKVLSAPKYSVNFNVKNKTPILIPSIHMPDTPTSDSETIVKFNNVSVRYGDKTILDNINWTIKSKEKWILKGENGAGKSTILSLIYADHPQSYANDIEVFQKKRGAGESIWDIKEKIGYYSPEMFYYFDKQLSCEETIYSGIYKHPYKKEIKNPKLEQFAKELFHLYFSEDHLKLSLRQLSPVMQRVALFISALAQNASLLLLDEPFQGFDEELRDKSKLIIDSYCKYKTLIFISHEQNDIPFCIKKTFSLNKL